MAAVSCGAPAPDPRSFPEHAAGAVPGPVGDGIARVASLQPGTPAWKAAGQRFNPLTGLRRGPREWDVALTAVYYDSFGWHTRDEYETFVRMYGIDIMQWTGYPVMRAVREFLMVTWIIQGAKGNERVASEAAKRISALRTGASRKDWQPY